VHRAGRQEFQISSLRATALRKKRFLDFAGDGKRMECQMGKIKTSAGLLMFRTDQSELEVLLVHPGGPYFRNKDAGAWTIPKGEAVENEDLLARGKTEFEEELGISVLAAANHGGDDNAWIELGSVKQKGGKTVHAWAFAGELAPDFKLASNTFEMEWPPRSGKKQQFPEIDQASFFPLAVARSKINPAQVLFLDRLADALDMPQPGGAE
jgi:predicted NUDIX family NTP pyrophosphohydrolase